MNNKVVLHSNIAWTISNFRLEIIKHLVNQGYEVLCVANNDNFNTNSVKEIIDAGATYINIQIDRKGLNPYRDVIYAFKLFKILKREKPDVIFNYTIKPVIYGSFIAKVLKIKSVSVITGLGYVFINKGLLHKLIRNLYKYALNSCKKVLFLNREDQSEFIQDGIILEQKSLVLPGEGINTKYFSPQKIEDQSGRFVFIKICRLLWDKGLREYFTAAEITKKAYPQCEFQLLGFIDENNPSAVSRSDIHELEKKGVIKYLGVTNDVRPFIAKADCIVLASFYREGLPRTLLEAASMAKPIITTNSVGCKDAVDDGETGFLCEPKNSIDLAEKMGKILEMKDSERIAMGLKGREKVINQFDQRIVNNIYDKVLSEINVIV